MKKVGLEKLEKQERKFSSPQEKIEYLRNEVACNKKEIEEKGEFADASKIAPEKILEYKNTNLKKTLAKDYVLKPKEANEIVLDLSSEKRDKKVEEIIGLFQEKGILNTISVVEKMDDVHLNDDFQRFFVQYIKFGLPIYGLKEKTSLFKTLKMTLFEISLLKVSDEGEKQKSLKKTISSMEQFYAGMSGREFCNQACFSISVFSSLFKSVSLTAFSILFFIFSAYSAFAANFYFSPASGSYPVGSILSTSIYISTSPDQVIKSASGAFSFPPDKLEVVSILKSASIFSSWVRDPSFSNVDGVVNFEGVISDAGFKGSSGKIMTVNFKVKTDDVADLSFSSGFIATNDEQDTNVLENIGTAEFNLGDIGASISESTTSLIVRDPSLATQAVSSDHTESNLVQTGSLVANVLAITVSLASIIIILIIALWFIWIKFLNMRKRLRKEVRETGFEFHHSFDWLREDIQKQIQVFEESHSGKQMTKEEEGILGQLKDDLDKAERSVAKEIEDIQKEIR